MNQKLILGTVQFGLNYGINNSTGKPKLHEVFEILDTAWDQGIRKLDTADVYGDAIDQIGAYHQQREHRFELLSKFKGVHGGDLKPILLSSLKRAGVDFFEVYSYHSYTDYISHPLLKEELQLLKVEKYILKTGISIYTHQEMEAAVADPNIDVIQLPFNLLDNYNLRGELMELAKSLNKEIHIRSSFLQGLFFMDTQKIPEKLQPLIPYLDKLKNICTNAGVSLHAAALSYAIFNKCIDHVLIGVDTKSQLLSNLNAIQEMNAVFDEVNNQIKVNEVALLNPVNWK